jgi:general secretion pathway protein A
MYAQYFGLKENPFALPPDPRYLYLSPRHQEALAHLMYGITGGGGFVQLTGEVGTGKTMMVRALLERLPDTVDVALVLYPFLSVREFLAAILDDLRIKRPDEATLKTLIDTLNAFLLENHAKGRRTVLIVDEAHKLNRDVLEQIRMLTNLETTKEKLLQIILVGQPELAALLAQPDLRQLAQRITARYNLKALRVRETREYVLHRLRVAGAQIPLFGRLALMRVHHLSRGVPRLINVICDRALLGAYGHGQHRVGMWTVTHAAAEVDRPGAQRRLRAAGTAILLLVIVAAGGWRFLLEPVSQALTPGARIAVATPPAETPETTQTVTGNAPGSGVAPAVPTPPAGPTLQQVLADPAAATDTDSAFAGLFSHWQLDYTQFAGITGCERAENAKLRCLYESGTWNNVRQLNRPVIVELVDAAGGRHHVLVARLNGERATLEVSGKNYEFGFAEIDRFWFGKYLALWCPPDSGEKVVRRGMRGRPVAWVRDALAKYGLARTSAPASDMFDAELETQVREFQRRHQLEEDGVVGKMTLVYLSTYDGAVAQPLLLSATPDTVAR